jgi:hypothetical protein
MYKVYYTGSDNKPYANDFMDMGEALKHTHYLRNAGMNFVVMSAENPNSVGKPGVDSVIDGVLPDGNIYEWKMRR